MAWFEKRQQLDADLSNEIQNHLEQKTQDLIAEGLSPEAAALAARRKFGNITLIAEQGREIWSWPWIEQLRMDLRFARRQLRRSPGSSLAAIISIALGIGATTAVFSVIYGALLSPYP